MSVRESLDKAVAYNSWVNLMVGHEQYVGGYAVKFFDSRDGTVLGLADKPRSTPDPSMEVTGVYVTDIRAVHIRKVQ